MPKLKTHSGAKKRFNLTKSGKVKRVYQGHYHPGQTETSHGVEYITFPAMCEQEDARFVIEL